MILFTVLWALVVLITDSRQSSETSETIEEEAESFREYLEKSVDGKPTQDYEYSSANAWENSGKFEGDMVLTKDQIDGLVEQVVKGYSRNGLKNMRKRWPHNTVVYLIYPRKKDELQTFKKALAVIEDNSCIKFRSKTRTDKNYVVIQDYKPGCSSNVGFIGGRQNISLGKNCWTEGVIVHEMLHTLGFMHMHAHHTRDNFVKIEWNNIKEAHKHNYIKVGTGILTDYGIPYDYESIMHYTSHAGSKNGKATMTSKKKNRAIKPSSKLTSSDIKKLNLMYKCKDKKKSINSPRNSKTRKA